MRSPENPMLRECVGFDAPPVPRVALRLCASAELEPGRGARATRWPLAKLPGRRSCHPQPAGIFARAEDVFCAGSGSHTGAILLMSKNLDSAFSKEAALCLFGKGKQSASVSLGTLRPPAQKRGG